jgi:hypothetical protein
MTNLFRAGGEAIAAAVQPHLEDATGFGSDLAQAGSEGLSQLGALVEEAGGEFLEGLGMAGDQIREWLESLTEEQRTSVGALFHAISQLKTVGVRLDTAGANVLSAVGRPLDAMLTDGHFQNAATLAGVVTETFNTAAVVLQAFKLVIADFPLDDLPRVLTDVDPRLAQWLDKETVL